MRQQSNQPLAFRDLGPPPRADPRGEIGGVHAMMILAELGPATDPWTIAAWFQFPNGWIVEDGPSGTMVRRP